MTDAELKVGLAFYGISCTQSCPDAPKLDSNRFNAPQVQVHT